MSDKPFKPGEFGPLNIEGDGTNVRIHEGLVIITNANGQAVSLTHDGVEFLRGFLDNYRAKAREYYERL